jgi:hypothetical protein
MANLNLTCTTTASGLTSDVISSTVLKTRTVTEGGITRMTISELVGGTPHVVAAAADYSEGSIVYLKNASSSAINLYVKTEAGANAIYQLYLTPGDFACFPWSAAVNIICYRDGGSNGLLEYGIFE